MPKAIIKKYIQENKSCVAWKIGDNGHLKFCELFPIQVVKSTLKLRIPEYSLDQLKELVTSQEKVLLLFEDDGVLVACAINQFNDDHEIELKLDDSFERLNRRSTDRYSFKKLIQVVIANESGLEAKYFGNDLSETGFSIVLMQNQKEIFKKSQRCFLRIGNENPLVLELEVVATNKLRPYENSNLPYSKSKVAFKFVEPNQSWAETIRSLMGAKIN
jgi:hypothetical protein